MSKIVEANEKIAEVVVDGYKKIRSKYLPKEESKLEKLIRLDKQTEKKGQAVSIALGVIGSLLLGVGMCCTMVWNEGIVIRRL